MTVFVSCSLCDISFKVEMFVDIASIIAFCLKSKV